MQKVFIGFLLSIAVLLAVLIINTLMQGVKSESLEPIDIKKIPRESIENFAEALRLKTVSNDDQKHIDTVAYSGFNTYLESNFPICYMNAQHHIINHFSHVFIFQGDNSDLKPALLYGHIDVVPTIEENVDDWVIEPWEGKILNDTIYGRGALDDKIAVVGMLNAMELFLREGKTLKRSVVFAFGHDEEVGGHDGAKEIAEFFKERNMQFEFLLDEGLTITKDLVPDMSQNVALIGLAQKGYLTLELSVNKEGGHSSMPEKETTIDILANAVSKVKSTPFTSHLTIPVRKMLHRIAPEMPFYKRVIVSNLWLFSGLVKKLYSKTNVGNATTRTTIAPTIFESGTKENILPKHARAVINFRTLPGQVKSDVISHVKNSIQDDRVVIRALAHDRESSPIAEMEDAGFKLIEKSIKEIFPETIVSPGIVMAGTDASKFWEFCENSYYFRPFIMHPKNLHCIHGINERVAIEEYKNLIRFYFRMFENMN